MGLIRKSLRVVTLPAGPLGVKASSKKQRVAKAALNESRRQSGMMAGLHPRHPDSPYFKEWHTTKGSRHRAARVARKHPTPENIAALEAIDATLREIESR